MTAQQIKYKVEELPTVLEYSSYVFYFGSNAMGYFFEFSDYKRFIEETDEYKEVTCPIFESICWLVTGMGCLILYTLGKIYCPISQCWTDYYESWPFYTKVVYFYIGLTLHRFFYYVAFCTTTGVVIASGFGYNGRDKATG